MAKPKTKTKEPTRYPCTACGRSYTRLYTFLKHAKKHEEDAKSADKVTKKLARGEKLTPKEEAFTKEYVKNGRNGVQAALATYNTKSYKTASTIADANLEKPRVRQAVKSIAESIPDELLIKVHLEGLGAYRKSTSFNKDEGEVESVDPDFGVRHKYLDTAYKLKGLLVDKSEMKLGVIGVVKHLYQRVDELDNGKETT